MANITPNKTATELLNYTVSILATSSTYVTKVQFTKIMTELTRLLGRFTIVEKNAAFTITKADEEKIFICTGGAYNITIDPTGMPIGFNCVVIDEDLGTQKTFVSSADITQADGFVKTENQYCPVSILMTGVNKIFLNGRLSE